MSNLNKKSILLNWREKKLQRNRYDKIPDNFIGVVRVNKLESSNKYNQYALNFNLDLINKYFPDLKEGERPKVAISFEESHILFCFNPSNGVPFFPLSKQGVVWCIRDRDVIDDIYKFFKLSNTTTKYFLKLHFYAQLHGLKLYAVTPQDYITKLPIFDDERKPDFSIK